MKRRAIAILLLVLALVAFCWPVHARTATGATSRNGLVTFVGVHTVTCPLQLQLGTTSDAGQIVPPNGDSEGADVLRYYAQANCSAARYNRVSGVLLLVIAGMIVGLSGVRARSQPSHIPVTVLAA